MHLMSIILLFGEFINILENNNSINVSNTEDDNDSSLESKLNISQAIFG